MNANGTTSNSKRALALTGIAAAVVALVFAGMVLAGAASASAAQPAAGGSGAIANVAQTVAASCPSYVDADGDGICDHCGAGKGDCASAARQGWGAHHGMGYGCGTGSGTGSGVGAHHGMGHCR